MRGDWSSGIDELKAIRKIVSKKINIVDLVSRYSNMTEQHYSGEYTHRCICPNPMHKNGNENTPSFFFSDSNGRYCCFGCHISGDVFDLISLMEGMPWFSVINKFLKKNKVSVSDFSLDLEVELNSAQNYNSIYDCNIELSVTLRDYLCSIKDKEDYTKEVLWVDNLFKRMDERFLKLTNEDTEQIRGFRSQILLELDRHKSNSRLK